MSTGCRHSWCALHYPFLAMICNHMRGTSVMPSSWHTSYTVVPSAPAPSASSTNSGHLPQRCAFIGDEVDRVTEEHRIHIVDECGKIDCFSLEEIGFCPQHFEVLLRVPERVC